MNDLISRQDAIDAFDCSIGGVPFDSVQYVIEYADKMVSRLSALPSAEPELVNNSPELKKLFGELRAKYEWAKEQKWINKPLGYALYYVWKEYDERNELL